MSLTLMPHVLVVDDDARLRALITRYLADQGFVAISAIDAADARAKLAQLSVDLMVIDVMMPGESGFDLTRALRAQEPSQPALPILLLTAKGEPGDRITGLEAGADDYLLKPFEPRELLLRINAILRRAPRPAASPRPELRLGAWIYVMDRDELRSDAETLALTGMEAGLMRALAASPGQVVSREMLATRSGGGASINDRTIDVQVTRLRRKIEPDARNPRYLVTVRGGGYSLRPDG